MEAEMIPLRDLFEQHHREVRDRLDRLESKVDAMAVHEHRENVPWVAFLPALVGLIGLIVGLS